MEHREMNRHTKSAGELEMTRDYLDKCCVWPM